MPAVLTAKDFQCRPNIVPSTGGDVAFDFKARSVGVSQLRARYFIPSGEPFSFSPAESGDPKEVFFPSIHGFTPAPGALGNVGPKRTTLVPLGAANPSPETPLKIFLEVFGFNAAGQQVATAKNSVRVTFAKPAAAFNVLSSSFNLTASDLSAAIAQPPTPLSVALRNLLNELDLTQVEVSDGLGVSTTTLRKVLQGGDSDKVREALADKLRGQ